MKRYGILAACVAMLVLLGTGQAWSVFVISLRDRYGYSAFQMQLIFNTSTFVFCTMIIPAGRLHDRFGPRPLAFASATFFGMAWSLAATLGNRYIFLWLGLGLLAGCGGAAGYVCPLATAIRWFPRRRGLAVGLTTAGFACGPILLSNLAGFFLARGLTPLQVFGRVAMIYTPLLFLIGRCLRWPPDVVERQTFVPFRRRGLLRDNRFWILFAGMFIGSLPYLVVMGNARPLSLEFGLSSGAATLAISILATGNASGRIFWGVIVDRFGTRRAMLSSQFLVIAALGLLLTTGRQLPACFLASLLIIGFCYGSNFAIFPATVATFYGIHVLGSVYPFIIGAQALASFGTSINGKLHDVTGSSTPALIVVLGVAFVGYLFCRLRLNSHNL